MIANMYGATCRSFGNSTGNATHDPTEAIFRNFSHMRLQMLPMLQSAAVKASIDGTPLVQRLDFSFPKEIDATRLDQYLFLESMLVAPVNPFVNGSKPWTDGQTGKDPKNPGSFNSTRDVSSTLDMCNGYTHPLAQFH